VGRVEPNHALAPERDIIRPKNIASSERIIAAYQYVEDLLTVTLMAAPTVHVCLIVGPAVTNYSTAVDFLLHYLRDFTLQIDLLFAV
jgi:hypothetical protein